MKVIATNIGERKTVQWKGKTYETGIYKYPVASITLGPTDVENDAVIDRRYHGGIDNAVYAYNADHYSYWKELYPNLAWDYGMFGENLTIEGLDETTLNVGSVFKVGEAIIEVTKPREPCVKLGMRFQDAKVIKQFWEQNMSGVYFKVLTNGKVKAGDVLELVEEKTANMTIAQVYESLKK